MAPASTFLTLLFVASPLLFKAVSANKKDREACQTPVCHESARIVLDSMNPSADPCDDFYQYACGGWIAKNPIPEEKKYYSVLGALTDEVHDKVAELLKSATNEDHPKPVLDAAKLFQGCIDLDARERQGLDPLKNLLNSFGGWPMGNPGWSDAGYQWSTQAANIRRMLGINVIIGIDVDTDQSQPTRNIITLIEPDFGLPNKYLTNFTASDRAIELVAAYRDYIIATGKLMNPNADDAQLENDADEIIEFESSLAKPDFRERNFTLSGKWYEEFMEYLEQEINQETKREGMTVGDLQANAGNENFSWKDFLNIVFQDFPELTDSTGISLYGMDYLPKAVELATDTNPRIVANYIGWVVLKTIGGSTTKAFRENAFRFKKVLDIVKKQPNLERTCADEITELMGYAVGRLYVDKEISDEELHDIEALIEDIRAAFEVNLNHNAWMDPETKTKALEKLRTMINLVGYPPWIKNDTELIDFYSMVEDVKEDEYFASKTNAMGAVTGKNLEKWNQPAQRTDWFTFPPVVNAYYNPISNTMTFPAAIFNVPVYKYGRSPALNYAGIGSFVAHEITHGFDNSGRHFNKIGNREDWWSKETATKFRERADCMRKQYSGYVEPMTNMSVDGDKTIGDNIADNGGARNSFMAYRLKVLQAEENEVIPNLRLPGIEASPEQLFFIGLAMMECTHHSKSSMKWTIEKDDHAPGEYRVLGPLSNSRAFAEAFDCPVGSRMNPEVKCQLW